MFHFVQWLRKNFVNEAARGGRRPRRSTRSRTARRPGLEGLEDRTVPTVVFDPQFPAETATTPANTTTLVNTPIDLVFWGSYWQSTLGQSQVADLVSSASALFPQVTSTSSPTGFQSQLQQYGVQGNAFYQTDIFLNSPGSGDFSNTTFTNGQLTNTLETGNPNKSGTATNPNPTGATNSTLYVFVTPPGTTDSSLSSTAGGYHNWDTTANTAWAWVFTPAG
jgi:hypothetical protein